MIISKPANMGGCRCTFRNCENSTSSKPGMHFFHFPIRDWDRLEVWAANAEKLEFKELPLSKLKNKVVCQEHFEDRMFMNYLKESLVKTAIPTLAVLDDGRILNIETNSVCKREEWRVPEANSGDADACAPSTESQTTRMEIQFVDSDQEEFNITPVAAKKPIVLNETPSATPIKLSLAKTSKNSQLSNAGLRKVIIKRKNTSEDVTPGPSKVQLLSIQRIPKKVIPAPEIQQESIIIEEVQSLATPSSTTDASVENSQTIINESLPIPVTVPTTAPPPSTLQMTLDPNYIEKLEQTSAGIEELKKILTDVLNKPALEPQIIKVPVVTPAAHAENNDYPKAEKGPHMNKVQLFNGIKRYLNPTMVTMLRMELFAGSPDRQWKSDEKSFAVELINLGESVYDHFCDEFRFRLPSKKDVETWKTQALDDDDDAS